MSARPFIGTAVFCAIVVFFTAQVHGGFMLLFVAPFLAVWMIYSTYVAWKHPARRSAQAFKVGLWLLAVSGVLLLHWNYHRAARDAADIAADAVLRYKQAHGAFPETLQAAGLTRQPRQNWRVSYLLKDGEPNMFYPATFVIFDTYWYDFGSRSWTYQPD